MINGTVALPIWNSKRIAWLVMESLCRQTKPSDGWELVVFEEQHYEQLGEGIIRSYEDRLSLAGCEKITYITSDIKIALSQKWVTIARNASGTSRYFCLCGADDYYHDHLLIEAESAIKYVDWAVTTRGYFYDFKTDKVLMYNHNAIIGLHMIANTKMVQEFAADEVHRGVDGWFSEQMKIQSRLNGGKLRCLIFGSDHWEQVLCTNGLNNISLNRGNYFKNPHPPFYGTSKKLSEIIPDDIYLRLNDISLSMKPNDDMG